MNHRPCFTIHVIIIQLILLKRLFLPRAKLKWWSTWVWLHRTGAPDNDDKVYYSLTVPDPISYIPLIHDTPSYNV